MLKKNFAGLAVIGALALSSVAASAQTISLRDLNQMSQPDFEAALGGIFNRAPWAVSQLAAKRPFVGFVDMYEQMIAEVKTAGHDKQMSAVLGHPELACKSVRAQNIAANSLKEQSASGLNECTEAEVALIQKLNKQYKDKFGYHFMLAIKGYDKAEIIDEFQLRLNNTQEQEFENAMQQVYKIAMTRLLDKVK
ncbi:2-oxo-4-hydroxy-4-carboxy-5-ureidoimidazoline decarboxylase [Achromobacter sp. NPDC058515]|uniref:2-oxo-4-hydroxy-4-carboxy-5-ureidoimidazoline decarboxylase n=1 Tax=Achromobacter sp. NPDC058515 TaxID=3346533 RepID=UPI003663D852